MDVTHPSFLSDLKGRTLQLNHGTTVEFTSKEVATLASSIVYGDHGGVQTVRSLVRSGGFVELARPVLLSVKVDRGVVVLVVGE